MRKAFKPVLTTTLWMDGDLLNDVDRVGVSLWGVWNLPLGRRDDVDRAGVSLERLEPPSGASGTFPLVFPWAAAAAAAAADKGRWR